MASKLQSSLKIPASRLQAINDVLLNPKMTVMKEFLGVVARYGTPEAINRKSAAAGSLPALLALVRDGHPENFRNLEWLKEQCQRGAFVRLADYRRKVLGGGAREVGPAEERAVEGGRSGARFHQPA